MNDADAADQFHVEPERRQRAGVSADSKKGDVTETQLAVIAPAAGLRLIARDDEDAVVIKAFRR